MLPPPLKLGITVTASLCITAAHSHQSTNFSNMDSEVEISLREVTRDHDLSRNLLIWQLLKLE
jgi:hypothetical protein